MLAARNQHGIALRARSKCASRLARVIVGPHAMVRGDLGLVMVRRDERRAGIAREVRDFRVDDERWTPGLTLA